MGHPAFVTSTVGDGPDRRRARFASGSSITPTRFRKRVHELSNVCLDRRLRHRARRCGSLRSGLPCGSPVPCILSRLGLVQPAFAAANHPIQTLPHFLGMLLVGGFAALIAGLHQVAPDSARVRTTVALVFTGAFAAMIFTNYAIQTTVVPALVASAGAGDASLIALLTMVNPMSLGWKLEMWSYAVLGVATWFAAAAFGPSRVERMTALLFVLNGREHREPHRRPRCGPAGFSARLASAGLWYMECAGHRNARLDDPEHAVAPIDRRITVETWQDIPERRSIQALVQHYRCVL